MEYTVTDELLESLKSELQITFSERDESLKKSLKRGMAFITSRVGDVEFNGDSEVSLLANDLLINYCRYDWDGYRQVFAGDYKSDILNLQVVNGIARRNHDEAKT